MYFQWIFRPILRFATVKVTTSNTGYSCQRLGWFNSTVTVSGSSSFFYLFDRFDSTLSAQWRQIWLIDRKEKSFCWLMRWFQCIGDVGPLSREKESILWKICLSMLTRVRLCLLFLIISPFFSSYFCLIVKSTESKKQEKEIVAVNEKRTGEFSFPFLDLTIDIRFSADNEHALDVWFDPRMVTSRHRSMSHRCFTTSTIVSEFAYKSKIMETFFDSFNSKWNEITRKQSSVCSFFYTSHHCLSARAKNTDNLEVSLLPFTHIKDHSHSDHIDMILTQNSFYSSISSLTLPFPLLA